MGLGKGTCIFIDVVWEDPNEKLDINKLPKGRITNASQPTYIIIKVRQQYLAIKKGNASLKDVKGKTRTFSMHQCESCLAVTHHKMQGKTERNPILSLNSRSNVSKKILPVSLRSVYVGCSRVHNHQGLRILPLSDEDKTYLKTLR